MSEIDNQITTLIQDDIRRKGLVDTGKLLRSIKVNSYNAGKSFGFDVVAEDYFEYLDAKYNIIEDVTNSSKFINIIEDYMVKQIESSIDKKIN
tara:strand:+ start:58 stop:336 length:279 start_codon:yes stop_codon:yes gene_type:complete